MGLFNDIFGFKARRALREQKKADAAAEAAATIQRRLSRYQTQFPRPAVTAPPGALTAQNAARTERRRQDELSLRRRASIDEASPMPIHDALYPLYTSNGTYEASPGAGSCSSSSDSSDSGSCGGSD